MPTEKSLQQWTKKKVKECGGLCYKFEAPGQPGVPDLLIVLPRGKIFFIELKSPMKTGRLSAIQRYRIDELREHGATVFVCDSKELVLAALRREGCDV